MNCTYCKKPVVLSPSAAERAAKDVTGKSAAYYTRLFPNHAACSIAARSAAAIDAMRRRVEREAAMRVVL
jgi:hypothetical protein